MATHLQLVPTPPTETSSRRVEVADVVGLLGQLGAAARASSRQSRAELYDRAMASPTGAVHRVRLVR